MFSHIIVFPLMRYAGEGAFNFVVIGSKLGYPSCTQKKRVINSVSRGIA